MEPNGPKPSGAAALLAATPATPPKLAPPLFMGDSPDPPEPPECLRSLARRLENHTWMRASVRLVDCASSSLVYTSGYWVRAKARSSASSCSAVKVVRDRRCLRFKGMPGSDSVSLMSESRPEREREKG